jgi:membrane-bound inhibitor of C-type lysozyme
VTGKSLTGSASDEIVTTSVTDVYGHTLYMEFNNSQGTAAFTLGDDMILLKQDTMASGVRFSNEHYIYTEHQGEIRLTRDGQVIFEHQN